MSDQPILIAVKRLVGDIHERIDLTREQHRTAETAARETLATQSNELATLKVAFQEQKALLATASEELRAAMEAFKAEIQAVRQAIPTIPPPVDLSGVALLSHTQEMAQRQQESITAFNGEVEKLRTELRDAVQVQVITAYENTTKDLEILRLNLINVINERALPGRDGKDGEDGKSIKGDKGEDGESIKGDKGDKGDAGESIKGQDGRGIESVNAEADADDPRKINLRFKYTDGQESAFEFRTPGIVVRGLYDSTATYQRGDVATLDGCSWIAKRDGAGKIIGGRDWTLMAHRGPRGEKGQVGTMPFTMEEIVTMMREIASGEK